MKNSCYQVVHHYNKLQEKGVPDVANRNEIKLVPYGDLPDQSFSQFKENSINNQDPHSQTENDETPEVEIPMKMIQKSKKQIKRLQFQALCHKYYQMRKSQQA